MVEQGSLRLISDGLRTNNIQLYIGYTKDIIKATGGSQKLGDYTNVYSNLLKSFLNLFDRTTNKNVKIRRIGISFNNLIDDRNVQLNLFTNNEKVHKEMQNKKD